MNYPGRLIIVPLEDKVLLPSAILRLTIRGKQASELTKSYFRTVSSSKVKPSHDVFVACIPLKRNTPRAEINQILGDNDGNNDVVSSQAPQVPIMAQKNDSIYPQPTEDDNDMGVLVSSKDRHCLFEFGCLARIVRVQRSGHNQFGVFIEGITRFKVDSFYQHTSSMVFPSCWFASVSYIPDLTLLPDNPVVLALYELTQVFVTKMKELKLPDTLSSQLAKVVQASSVSDLADLLVSIIEVTFEEKLIMLNTACLKTRIQKTAEWLTRQLHVLQIADSFESGVEGKLSMKQREFYLRQQLESIQDELGSDSSQRPSLENSSTEEDELSHLHRRLVQANLPNEVVTVAQREMNRIKKLQPSSPEWAVSRNYLEWIADLPWNIKSLTNIDTKQAKRQLDHDHFGLDHVKKRVIEYLSVIKIKGDLRAPILCFVGPPGVGKTSLGRSIAHSMSREFHRIALGGVRDEADMRGHRRTYVSAMPGLIIQGLRKAKVNNPLFLLDEIDKLAHSSSHGDPAAALLEVLDPEQNHTFADHYLNVPFDLSNVLFIATANSLDTIPEALLDRMEVIELHGYTFEEKLYIAKTHLVPKQILAHGLRLNQVKISDSAIVFVAENYTRESGVRNLERALASIVRSKCVEIADLKDSNLDASRYTPFIDVKEVEFILGNAKFEKEALERESVPGVVTGLAYSGSGNGGILFVEASKMPGDGRLLLTGSLGNVIQESAKLALSWVKSNAFALKLTNTAREKLIEHDDIHIHFPSGSVPKDGPSAGVTLVCAIVSLYSSKSIHTSIAMTGEISLRGQVLPVGGIKEKIISAHRAGIRKIIIPARNQKDIETDVPETVRNDITFCYAKNIWNVLEAACLLPVNISNYRMIEESHL